MKMKSWVWVAGCCLPMLTVCIADAQDVNSPRYRAAMTFSQFANGELPVERFLADHVDRELADREGTEARLREIQEQLQARQLARFQPAGEFAVELTFSDSPVVIQLADEPPHGLIGISTSFGLQLGEGQALDRPVIERLTLENLAARLKDLEKQGFSGSVLVKHAGEIVHHAGYGFANREKKIRNTADTVFATGSLPIDYTHVAILQLVEQGKLSLDDPITKFFDNVPDDKREISVEHLRTGQSGLRDFHDVPGDENPDHTWIDREEAVRRIMKQELHFAPGTGRQHSHSAWGLLAAIVEIVSQQSYQAYTAANIFEPAGMKDTGFFGQSVPESKIAVGYGRRSNERVNSPDNWGQTSWLVMGSGGQISTTGDINRFLDALHQGKLLKPESLRKYFRGGMGMAAAGDMFGFELFYTQRPDSRFVLLSNDASQPPGRQMVRDLAQAINQMLQPARRFSLGIMMDVDTEQGVTLQSVVPGSAAEASGLLADDRLIAANGKPLGDDPMAVLDPYLADGKTIEFDLIRNGKELKIAVKPRAVDEQNAPRPDQPQAPPPVPSDDQLTAGTTTIAGQLGSMVADLATKDRFSGAILLALNDEILLQNAYGLASRRFDVPNQIDTKFNIGSMNKMFTGVAICKLYEQGKLAFTDTVGKHLPDYPNRQVADQVTIHQLLTHTSGLGSYWNDEYNKRFIHLRTLNDYLPVFADQSPEFEPGARFRYSNVGPMILGLVIEKISGQSYYDFVRQHVFHPAGMNDTDCYEMDQPIPNLAIGYTRLNLDGSRGNTWRNNYFMHSVKGGPAGGGFSTTGDLYRFAQALMSDKLLASETRELLLTGKIDQGPGFKYAYLFGDHRESGFRRHGHNGGGPGISAELGFYPELGITYVVLANIDRAVMPISSAVNQMIARRFSSDQLASSGPTGKYRIGLAFGTDGENFFVEQAFADGPAARAGLQDGDRIVAMNGNEFGESWLNQLDQLLSAGKPIQFTVVREGRTLALDVQPELIE